MTKIRSSNTTKGRPGGWGRSAPGQKGGGLVNKTRAGMFGIRRLIARDPSSGISGLIGSKRDPGNLGTVQVAKEATLVMNDGGAATNLKFTSKAESAAANNITVAYVNPGTNNAALGVVVAGSAITVNLATNGSAVATSTAAQVLAALLASTPAMALVSVEYDPADTTGVTTGVVAVKSATHLAGGLDFAGISSNSPNTQGASSPTVKSDSVSRRSVPKGQERVADKGTNRKTRITRF
jgi:hypothetical protein